MSDPNSDLESFLNDAGISITEFMPDKPRPFRVIPGGTMGTLGLLKRMKASDTFNYPSVSKLLMNEAVLYRALEKYCKGKGLESIVVKVQADESEVSRLSKLVLYKDASFTIEKEPAYYVGTKEGRLTGDPAHHYLAILGIENPALEAIPVIPEYSPRDPLGIYKKKTPHGEERSHLNKYIPPKWIDYEKELPDELPPLFKKLVDHVFPTEEGREYFFHWTYCSLVSRAETYLVLQGAPAVGKNRLKIHLRALHGHNNSVDGKKSTLTTQFNSQLGEGTLVYFDEIKYTEEEENIMKEVPNGTISIEAKGVDATRSTPIFCSLILANNKERDCFIAFDARKFCPVELNEESLQRSMTEAEIREMSEKVEYESRPGFDIEYVAQIGRWILKHGKSKKWKGCEYKGPKFWYLANSSMALWQKRMLAFIFSPPELTEDFSQRKKFSYDEMYQIYEKRILKKDKRSNGITVAYSTAQHFFEKYRDLNGNRIFKVKKIKDSIIDDFIIEIIRDLKHTEDRPEDLL